MRRRLCSSIVAVAAAFSFIAGPALADVVATHGGNGLAVTINDVAANVHFDFDPNGCDSNIPCLVITAGNGMIGATVSADGDCKAQSSAQVGSIQCPAAGVPSITFLFKNGGTWAAYAGGGGQHAHPCSPVPVTVQTGPDGGMVSVDSWNGYPETVICDSPKTMFTGIEADAADTVRGSCSSIVRH